MKGTSTCNISIQRDPQASIGKQNASVRSSVGFAGEKTPIPVPRSRPSLLCLKAQTQPWPPSKRAQ